LQTGILPSGAERTPRQAAPSRRLCEGDVSQPNVQQHDPDAFLRREAACFARGGRAPGDPAALEAEIARRKEAESRLDRLSAHQAQMIEEERKRIARELHDELGALLTGIGAHLSVALERAERAGAPAPQELLAAARLTGIAAQTVHRVVSELRPSVLDHLGIWAALEWYAGQVRERSGLRCQCSIAPELREVEPDAALATALFRIAQEALTNVVRHARASAASVRAVREGGRALVEIRDDGCGIEAGGLAPRGGFGIEGMVERARQCGAELRIDGEPGRGTVVALRFSLAAAKAQGAPDQH
jgi:two-component system sensor histidine kinase UhpB